MQQQAGKIHQCSLQLSLTNNFKNLPQPHWCYIAHSFKQCSFSKTLSDETAQLRLCFSWQVGVQQGEALKNRRNHHQKANVNVLCLSACAEPASRGLSLHHSLVTAKAALWLLAHHEQSVVCTLARSLEIMLMLCWRSQQLRTRHCPLCSCFPNCNTELMERCPLKINKFLLHITYMKN